MGERVTRERQKRLGQGYKEKKGEQGRGRRRSECLKQLSTQPAHPILPPPKASPFPT